MNDADFDPDSYEVLELDSCAGLVDFVSLAFGQHLNTGSQNQPDPKSTHSHGPKPERRARKTNVRSCLTYIGGSPQAFAAAPLGQLSPTPSRSPRPTPAPPAGLLLRNLR